MATNSSSETDENSKDIYPGPPETSWEHDFHEKLLTIFFAGYLIVNKEGFDILRKFVEDTELGVPNYIDPNSPLEGDKNTNFRDLVQKFDKVIRDPSNTISILKFIDVNDLDKEGERKEFYRKICKKYWTIEKERYKCLYKPDNMEDTLDTSKIYKYFDETKLHSTGDELPEEDVKSFIDERLEPRGFKFLFGRSDNKLAASLVKAIWSMKHEGEIRIAFVPREQLLSVDMEKREVRELTLQLYPHKPVFKRRDKDSIRGWEEMFPDGMPWCVVPGGRALSDIIDGNDNEIYKRISKIENPPTIFTEDKWLMDERKRIFREERKKEKEKSALKVNDPRIQVNHYLPILKEITGFRGRIRDERFYNGLQGLIYIIQVRDTSRDEDVTKFKDPYLKSLIESELAFREAKKKKERKDREEKRRKDEESEKNNETVA